MNENNPFSAPSRQSPAAIVLFLIKFLKITVRQAWPALIPLLVGTRKLDFSDWYVYALIIGVAAIYLFFSIFSYLRFYYHLNEGEIVIKKGVLTRTVVNLPFEKIQTIDFKQNILQQVFGVVEFAIDSAGSKKQEVSLTAIPLHQAEALRQFILDEKKQKATGQVEEAKSEEAISHEDSLILKLHISDLFKVGITQNHFKSFGLMIAFSFWVMDQVRKITQENDFGEEEIEETVVNYANGTLFFWLLFTLFLVFIPFVISLFSTVFRHFNMQLSLSKDGLKLTSGLFNKKQRSTTLNKVQATAWGHNPLQKLLQISTIKIYPASSASIRLKNILTIPGGKEKHVNILLENLGLGSKDAQFKTHQISEFYYKRTFWIVGIIPAFLATVVSFWNWSFYSLFFCLWPVLVGSTTYLQYKKWKILVNENILRIQFGLFGLHNKIIFWHKIQAVKISRTPFQNKYGLANITFYQAGHQIKVPYISIGLAEHLQSYALYKIESDQEGWM